MFSVGDEPSKAEIYAAITKVLEKLKIIESQIRDLKQNKNWHIKNNY